MGRSAASTVCFAFTRSFWRVNLGNMTDFGSIFARIWLFPGLFSVRWAQRSCGSRQLLAQDIDIGQGELAENLLAVFVQPAVAGLGVAELALDHAEDMLDLGAKP